MKDAANNKNYWKTIRVPMRVSATCQPLYRVIDELNIEMNSKGKDKIFIKWMNFHFHLRELIHSVLSSSDQTWYATFL